MDLKAQGKISKLLIEQADKLGKALRVLREIVGMPKDTTVEEIKAAASNTLREISDYGKDIEDL